MLYSTLRQYFHVAVTTTRSRCFLKLLHGAGSFPDKQNIKEQQASEVVRAGIAPKCNANRRRPTNGGPQADGDAGGPWSCASACGPPSCPGRTTSSARRPCRRRPTARGSLAVGAAATGQLGLGRKQTTHRALLTLLVPAAGERDGIAELVDAQVGRTQSLSLEISSHPSR
jgi:hypothetical protein